MSLERRVGDTGPVRPDPIGTQALRRSDRDGLLGAGTLACPACDAPVAPGPQPLAPADPIGCPVCLHGGAVRDFLSLAVPARPAHVEVRVVARRMA